MVLPCVDCGLTLVEVINALVGQSCSLCVKYVSFYYIKETKLHISIFLFI